jgi:hypothetical protein
MARSKPARERSPEVPPIEDRRVTAGQRGVGGALRRLKGALKRPLRLERRGLQLHIVLAERRRRPDSHHPPALQQLLDELGARMLAIEHEHAAAGMRALLRVHEALLRKGWPGVEIMSSREIGRALAQGELLASLEPSPAMSLLIERLRILQAGAVVREERQAASRADETHAQVEVSETDFDAFHETQRGWVDTVAPAPATATERGD